MTSAPSPTAHAAAIDHDAQARRIAVWGAWYHARNVVMQLRSWWMSLLLLGTLEPLLTVLALGVGMGLVVDAASPGALGVPFLQFVGPALLISVAVRCAQMENTLAVFSGFKWHELYHAAATTPTTPAQLAEGHWLGATVRYVVNCALVATVLVAFRAITPIGAVVLMPIAILTAWAFGNPTLAWAASLTEDKGQFSVFARFVVLPLTLFSGTYFPLDVLPRWLQPLGWASPLWHGVNLARIWTLGRVAPVWLPAVHIAYLTTLTVVGLLMARRFFHLRLTGQWRQREPSRRRDAEAVPAPSPDSLPSGQELLTRPGSSAMFSGNFPVVAARGLKANWGSN